MGFKKYIIASIILIAIVGTYVYNLGMGEFTFIIDTQIEGYVFEQTLPIYIWIIIPLIVLFIATIAHMIYYGSKNYFHKKALLSDIVTIQEHIEARLLNETSDKKLKTSELKDLANILDQLEINTIDEEFNSKNSKLNTIVEKVSKINNNEYIQSKYLKLDKENILSKQNLMNKINKENGFAMDVLKNSSSYDDDVIYLAFHNVIDAQPLEKIKPLLENLSLSNEMVALILLKDSLQDAALRFTNAEILALLKDKKLSNKELIEIAKNYKKTMQPEQLIQLFDDICTADENFTESYLYVLFDYQMISQIDEILVNSQKDEFTVFRALIDLKNAEKHYTVENLALS